MAIRDEYEIRQGRIKLYRRDSEGGKHQSDSWYCALKIPGQKTIRRSLRTPFQSEAESKAEDLWFELCQRADRGLSISTKRFDLVAKGFLSDFQSKVDREAQLPKQKQQYKPQLFRNKNLIITKYLIPYFEGKNLQDITDQNIINYENWRKHYWISGTGSQVEHIEYKRNGRTVRRPRVPRETTEPNWNTINKELTTLRQIFEYARRSNIIEGREIPVIRNVRKPRNTTSKKPGMSETEVKYFLQFMVDRYHAQKNEKHQRSHKLLIHYVSWLCLTGIRVSEAKNLRISDCRFFTKGGKSFLKVYVYGKGKSRELVAQEEAASLLEKLITFHKENAQLHGWEYSNNQHMFMDQYGRPVGSFARSLNNALELAGLLYDSHGQKRTGGTFRKYYISHALLVGKINYFELAKQTGNSVTVIEKYYAEIDPTERPEMFIFENALSGVYS